MRNGSVIVDVAVDQGGCVETTKATTHSDPTYSIDGVLHYCVANMPGAVPHTSTFALNNQTAPFIIRLAQEGINALRKDGALCRGLNTLAHQAVAQAFNLDLPFNNPATLLEIENDSARI